MKTIESMYELRTELKKIPKAKLQFVKTMTEFLASNNMSLTGDLLGKLTFANCDEIEEILKDGQDSIVTWTN